MLSLWCSKKEFMTAPGLPCCSRDRSGYLGPSNMAPPVDIPCLPIPSPTLRRGGYQGQSPWLVSELPTGTCPMSHGSTAALTPAQSAPLSLVARVVRIGLRMVAKPVLRANLSVEAARWQLRLANRLIPRPPRGSEPTVIDAGGVPAERVTTAASRHDRHIIYLHGGGYVAGWAGLCRDLTWRLATLCRVSVLGVNYRLAPEYPFPAALDDVVAA